MNLLTNGFVNDCGRLFGPSEQLEADIVELALKGFCVIDHSTWNTNQGPLDGRIGLLATVDCSGEEGRWILADSVPISPMRAVSASDYLRVVS
jgi:hypothetical protein